MGVKTFSGQKFGGEVLNFAHSPSQLMLAPGLTINVEVWLPNNVPQTCEVDSVDRVVWFEDCREYYTISHDEDQQNSEKGDLEIKEIFYILVNFASRHLLDFATFWLITNVKVTRKVICDKVAKTGMKKINIQIYFVRESFYQ